MAFRTWALCLMFWPGTIWAAEHSSRPIQQLIISGDIGGTNARFDLYAVPVPVAAPSDGRTRDTHQFGKVYRNRDYKTIEQIFRQVALYPSQQHLADLMSTRCCWLVHQRQQLLRWRWRRLAGSCRAGHRGTGGEQPR